MTSAEIRQSFLDFFRSKEHVIVPSSPVVLPTDPTLLFTNAGMNPFKDIFLGVRESQDKRVADTQKCIRVSGKHNDLEEVGVDTYHHTFFEMLGNWSFGDYYKREAIRWAWELLTEVWGLPKERLWATVYRDDDEAADLWREVTDIDPTRILRFGEKDNFWEMGDTGPCGPCSEIHIDLTAEGCGAELVNAGSPEVIELWNLVFIQYNRKNDGSLEELPCKHVDTGMGFERVAAVLQGKKSNYDSDIFTPLLEKIAALSGCTYEGEAAIAMRVIADHIRALSIAIADGVLPSNDGRGYVLRRLLRRAVRYGRQLGFREPFMGQLFPVVEQTLGPVFPELSAHRERVLRALQSEEESFAATLDRGISLFEDVVAELAKEKATLFPGEQAFKLYDTYGFPLDLTVLMAAERDLSVDTEAFDALMEAQRERARLDRKDAVLSGDLELLQALHAEGVRTQFAGYDRLELESDIAVVLADGQRQASLAEGERGEVILTETPFYSESGGQLGDQGVLRGPRGEFEVLDTQRPLEGLVVHIGRVIQGRLDEGDRVGAVVTAQRRVPMQLHHTATHLLNAALREVVSGTVRQAGSLVAPDRLRFDFTHYEAVHADDLATIERRVNQWIMDNTPVDTYSMAYKDVPESGIIAVFDEKYGDEVRVVDIGGYSRELCGGTHARATGQLGGFRILGESSVAAGVRRIEAVCGWAAYDVMQRERQWLRSLAQKFSAPAEELVQRVDHLVAQNRKLEKALKEQAAAAHRDAAAGLLDAVQQVGAVPLLAAVIPDAGVDGLREVLDAIRPKLASGVIVLGGAAEGKAAFVASVSADWVERGVHAGKLIGQVAKLAGGGGGGQPHKAQAGGKQPDQVPAAIAAVPDMVAALGVAG
jgi:alanyl-tRNA synthetase